MRNQDGGYFEHLHEKIFLFLIKSHRKTPLGTITRGHGIGSVLSSAELSTAIPLHTQKASILVKSQARIFAPPLSDQFCKKSEKFRIDSEWPETARNRKKNFCPLVTPPEKNLEKGAGNSWFVVVGALMIFTTIFVCSFTLYCLKYNGANFIIKIGVNSHK